MIISLSSPSLLKNITYINCGTASVPLSGHIDLTGFTSLESFRCTSNSLTGLYGYGENEALIDINVSNNKIRNNIERLDNKPLDLIYMQTNQFTGSIPSLPASAIKAYFNNNRFLTGNIPTLSSNSLLQELFVNSCSLSGTVPPLSSCVKLKVFNASSQLGATKLNGVFGNLEYNTSLNDALIHSNQIAEWSGEVPASLGFFLAHNNNLSTASVDSILQAFVNAGRDFGTRVLNLGGSGNQAPSPTGVNNKNILIGKGWTVTTN
jgi:hypothetical protein